MKYLLVLIVGMMLGELYGYLWLILGAAIGYAALIPSGSQVLEDSTISEDGLSSSSNEYHYDYHQINPATGLPIGGTGYFVVEGNEYCADRESIFNPNFTEDSYSTGLSSSFDVFDIDPITGLERYDGETGCVLWDDCFSDTDQYDSLT